MTRKSGFVALAGRPNVGKSTLVNALVGEKVAIVSDRPQTTRRAIRGVCTRGDSQIVLVDLPGVQRPRDALTERMAGRDALHFLEAESLLVEFGGLLGILRREGDMANLRHGILLFTSTCGGIPTVPRRVVGFCQMDTLARIWLICMSEPTIIGVGAKP